MPSTHIDSLPDEALVHCLSFLTQGERCGACLLAACRRRPSAAAASTAGSAPCLLHSASFLFASALQALHSSPGQPAVCSPRLQPGDAAARVSAEQLSAAAVQRPRAPRCGAHAIATAVAGKACAPHSQPEHFRHVRGVSKHRGGADRAGSAGGQLPYWLLRRRTAAAPDSSGLNRGSLHPLAEGPERDAGALETGSFQDWRSQARSSERC